MVRLQEGSKGKAICSECGLVDTVYQIRDVPFSDGSGIVSNLLVGICTQCNNVASIPSQSVGDIKGVYEELRYVQVNNVIGNKDITFKPTLDINIAEKPHDTFLVKVEQDVKLIFRAVKGNTNEKI